MYATSHPMLHAIQTKEFEARNAGPTHDHFGRAPKRWQAEARQAARRGGANR